MANSNHAPECVNAAEIFTGTFGVKQRALGLKRQAYSVKRQACGIIVVIDLARFLSIIKLSEKGNGRIRHQEGADSHCT